MFVHVENENYGGEVVTHQDWVVVGNPPSFKYDIASPTSWKTGSVDIFKYNPNTDQHDLILTLYRPLGFDNQTLLATDNPNGVLVHTDVWRYFWIPVYTSGGIFRWMNFGIGDIPIQIDAGTYFNTLEDDYGHALDLYNNVLVVGSRYFNQQATIENVITYVTGSSVDIYDLTQLKSDFFDGYVSTSSNFLVTVVPPPNTEPVSGSFGYVVGVNDEWLAVGSPLFNGSGSVHMYRRTFPSDTNNIGFTFYQTITGSSVKPGDQFGFSLDINKQTGSYSGSLVVGCGRRTVTSSFAYFFEFDGSNWKERNTFVSDRNIRYLPFYDVNPILTSSFYKADGYGNAVALWEDDLAVGAPTDRVFVEYTGSQIYRQGAAYLYHRCPDHSRGWSLVKKTYGNEKTIKNNKLGFSLSLWDQYFALGVPRFNIQDVGTCYYQGTVWQDIYCSDNLEHLLQGQWILFQKDTGSSDVDWNIVNVYQKKKKFMGPYRAFGYDIDIADRSVVVGSPSLISGSNRDINIFATASVQGENTFELDDLAGKSYIYNLKNLRENFHVGNVFYRNGKIVLNTSGSYFDGLWFNPLSTYNYEYEVHFDSKQTLYEKQIACVVEPGEFNTSTNPTAVTKPKADFDINRNGYFDWQDLDVILRYMQSINTRFDRYPTSDWSSSLLKTDDEISFYNWNVENVSYYNTDSDFISQSFFDILNDVGISQFDFNQDSKIDTNDLNIFWKYCSNRLNQINYATYITPNSKRRLFSDIVDHLNEKTQKKASYTILPEFSSFSSNTASDKTGSYLSPYVTTIGLYNGLDLVAVAKLGSPIKLTGEYPVNFLIKLDF
jgi:hypothetical protein